MKHTTIQAVKHFNTFWTICTRWPQHQVWDSTPRSWGISASARLAFVSDLLACDFSKWRWKILTIVLLGEAHTVFSWEEAKRFVQLQRLAHSWLGDGPTPAADQFRLKLGSRHWLVRIADLTLRSRLQILDVSHVQHGGKIILNQDVLPNCKYSCGNYEGEVDIARTSWGLTSPKYM